jgi:molybdenum cofactor cytidylyltransferase
VKPAGIILAAGESRRMGRAKAMLPFRGGTFLSQIAETLSRKCSPVIAVFGFDADRLCPLAPPGVIAVKNPDYQMGMLTSLQAGLRAVPDDCDAVMFTLVDHPAIAASTVDALAESKALIAIPRFAGKRGHPVLIGRPMFAEFLNAPLTAKVRDPIDRHSADITYIEVTDAGISDDIDNPQLYDQLLAREAARP